ncbi:MAG: indole-3-glycerol phosphate synthase TrpC [Acidimicrobiia bacterium]|nr:indole-3-glycerol phosphate synthase TrpC [Acidimicrobiia bacterium]
MPTILDEILAATASRLELSPVVVERAEALSGRPPPSFRDALAAPGLSVIAEIKRRSPSAGALAPDIDPVARASAYAAGGAAAVSVLTEPDFFGGSIEDMLVVAESVSIPVLRKDFILAPEQIWEARAWGAAAVLLIVSALDDARLSLLIDEARDAGLDALVEVHTPEEAHRARDAGASIVGVNNRDLSTFETDLAVAETIAPLLDGVVTVAESGISSAAGASRMAAAGYDAILVGEALVTAPEPAALIEALKGTAT